MAEHRHWRKLVWSPPCSIQHHGSQPLRRRPGSTNGTAVNGRRITEPTVLAKNNDVVNVGDVAIRVRYE